MILRDESWLALLRAVHMMAAGAMMKKEADLAKNLTDLHGVLRAMYARDRAEHFEPDGPHLARHAASRTAMGIVINRLMKGTQHGQS